MNTIYQHMMYLPPHPRKLSARKMFSRAHHIHCNNIIITDFNFPDKDVVKVKSLGRI